MIDEAPVGVAMAGGLARTAAGAVGRTLVGSVKSRVKSLIEDIFERRGEIGGISRILPIAPSVTRASLRASGPGSQQVLRTRTYDST